MGDTVNTHNELFGQPGFYNQFVSIEDLPLPTGREWERERMIHDVTAEDMMQDHISEAVNETQLLIQCKKLERLERRNFFECFTESEFAAICQHVSPNQLGAIRGLQYMPGGLAVIDGCSGSGKSWLIVTLMTHYILHFINAPTSSTMPHRKGLQGLIASPGTNNIKKLAESFCYSFRECGIKDDIIIKVTELSEFEGDAVTQILLIAEQVSRLLIRYEDSPLDMGNEPDAQGMDYSISSWLFAVLRRENRHDPAIQRIQSAIPWLQRQTLHKLLKECYDLTVITPDCRTAIITFLTRIVKILFRSADVVLCTVPIDESIQYFFEPRIYIMDEASKARGALGYSWVLFPTCRYRILFGDRHASDPYTKCTSSLAMLQIRQESTWYSALIHLGFPYVDFGNLEQHTFSQSLAAFLGDRFYEGPLACLSPVPTEVPEGLAKWNLFSHRCINVYGDLGIFAERCTNLTGSGYNLKCLQATWQAIRDLLDKSFSPKDIGILTPYACQALLHRTAAEQYCEEVGIPNEFVAETFFNVAGLRFDVIVVDLVSSNPVGITEDSKLLCTVLTRARYGIVVIADLEATLAFL